MTLDDLTTYQNNFKLFQKLMSQGAEVVILPVKTVPDDEERAAICTKQGEQIIPHAILAWDNPFELFKPLLIDTPKEVE